MKTVRHIAGPMEDQVQYCVICGTILTDYRGAMVPAGQPPLRGWQEGEVFVCGNTSSTVLLTDEFEDCKP